MENKRTDIIDEALKIIYLESTSSENDQSIDREISRIASAPIAFEMGSEKENQLLANLTGVLTTQSLGQVILKQLDVLKLSQDQLSKMTLLPADVIKDLIADNIYTNNVPIVLLKNLLKQLQIGISMMEQSIRKTFYLLENRPQNKEELKLHPSFRKGIYLSKEAASQMHSKSDGKELYENKEALDKYLSRLKELMD